MNRFLIAMIFVIASIQTSFATISSYCQKEVASASHIAHHEHQDSSKSAVNDSADSADSSDTECAVCHLAHSPALSYFSIQVTTFTGCQHVVSQAKLFKTITQKPPEKPNWFALA